MSAGAASAPVTVQTCCNEQGRRANKSRGAPAPSPSLPLPIPFTSFFSLPLLSPSLPLEVGPLLRLGGLGSVLAPPAGQPGRQTVFGEFLAKNLTSSSSNLQGLFRKWNIKLRDWVAEYLTFMSDCRRSGFEPRWGKRNLFVYIYRRYCYHLLGPSGGSEPDRPTRWTKEAIHIRKEGQRAMNREEGSYQLSHTYDCFLGVIYYLLRQEPNDEMFSFFWRLPMEVFRNVKVYNIFGRI